MKGCISVVNIFFSKIYKYHEINNKKQTLAIASLCVAITRSSENWLQVRSLDGDVILNMYGMVNRNGDVLVLGTGHGLLLDPAMVKANNKLQNAVSNVFWHAKQRHT